MMTKHLREPVQSEKLQVSPPIGTQPATFEDAGATDRATTNTTTSLKAAALRVLERNQQCNQDATELIKECNFSPQITPRKLHQSCGLRRLAENVLQTLTDTSPKAKLNDLPVHYGGGANGKAYGDTEWIRQQLKRLPPLMRKQAIETYSTLYQKAYNAEPKEHAKESEGRFVANNWLRLQVESVLKSRRSS